MTSPGQTFALSYEILWNPHMFPHVPCDFSQLSRKCPMILWWFSRCPMILWWFSYGFFPMFHLHIFCGEKPVTRGFFPGVFPVTTRRQGGSWRPRALPGRWGKEKKRRGGAVWGGLRLQSIGDMGQKPWENGDWMGFFDMNVILRLQSVSTIGKWWFNEDIQWYSWILMGAKTFMMTGHKNTPFLWMRMTTATEEQQ